MFEIVDDIVEAERQAEKIVSDARAEAEQVRSAFDQEERQALEEAQQEATRILKERVDAARKDADRRLEEALAADKTADQFMDAHPDRVEQAVDRVVELLLTPEHEQ